MFFWLFNLRKITVEELRTHNTANSAWVQVGNKVYDVTDLIYEHPAGSRLILQNAGTDITYHVQFHSKKMMKLLKPRLIGRIVSSPNEVTRRKTPSGRSFSL